jgi:polyhydroxyalkanoate synthesis regulator phasin
MADDLLRRLLDAGASFTQMTQPRAEAIVNELDRTGQLKVEEAQAAAADLVDRGRESTERLVSMMQAEVARQFSSMGVATRDDLAKLEAKLDRLSEPAKAPAKATAKKASPGVKKSAAKTAKSASKAAPKSSTKKATKTAKKTSSRPAKAAKKSAPPA